MVYQTEHFENRAGGKGWIHIEHLLPEEEKGMIKMYARVTIDPHASIGFHRHEGDGESYYIVSGKGAYSGEEKQVICCAVRKNDYVKVKRYVKEVDESAFMIITSAKEVLGKGFKEIN